MSTSKRNTPLSSTRYTYACIGYFAAFLVCLLLGAALGAVRASPLTGMTIGIAFGLFFLFPFGYCLYCRISYERKASALPRQRGRISNWNLGFYRSTGCICVNIGDTEYSTPAYFSTETAKELVGREISYCIIDDTLFIFELFEEVMGDY